MTLFIFVFHRRLNAVFISLRLKINFDQVQIRLMTLESPTLQILRLKNIHI